MKTLMQSRRAGSRLIGTRVIATMALMLGGLQSSRAASVQIRCPGTPQSVILTADYVNSLA